MDQFHESESPSVLESLEGIDTKMMAAKHNTMPTHF